MNATGLFLIAVAVASGAAAMLLHPAIPIGAEWDLTKSRISKAQRWRRLLSAVLSLVAVGCLTASLTIL